MRKTFRPSSSAVLASPGRTTVSRLRKRSRLVVRDGSVMESLHPVQYVADDRPARLARGGVLSKNPVLIGGIERAVFPLQRNPGIHERRPVRIAFTDGIR